MVIQVDQELCAGCGVCLDVCPVGAIQLVDYRAVIDNTLCTQCEACVDACPNGAILAKPIPAQSASLIKLPEAKSRSVPIRDQSALPEAATPARGLVPLAGTALAFLGREAAPRLIDMLMNALERRLAQPTTTRLSPISTSSRSFTTHSRGKRRQGRYHGGCTGYGNHRGGRR